MGVTWEEVGDVRLARGDCLEVLPTLADASVDAVVTDPPFKLSQEYGTGADSDNILAVSAIWPLAPELFRVAKPGAIAALFYDCRILPLALEAMRRAGWKYLRNLTMYRRWGQASIIHGWMSTSDFVLLFCKPGAKPEFFGDPEHDVYVKSSPEAESVNHPAQKPLKFCRQIVSKVCPDGGKVLDPFLGSGTTLKACIQTHRCGIGVERDPAYFATALARLRACHGVGSLFDPGRTGVDR